MATRRGVILGGLAALCLGVGAANASGPSATAPWYVDQYGGDPTDLQHFYSGRIGIVMPTAPRPMLFIDWRLLHGRKVGQAAGEALSTPCCSAPWWYQARAQDSGVKRWLAARKLVSGADNRSDIDTDRDGPDNTSVENCFDEAFDVAATTLNERIRRYGAASPGVKAWLAAQDAVFDACHEGTDDLPPAPPAPSAWLTTDRAYQAAALALYRGRNLDAARRFVAIAHDPVSPWRDHGLYSAARALVREALSEKTAIAWANARAAVQALAASPAGTFGRGQTGAMQNILDFHQQPEVLMTRLERELSATDPSADIDVSFRDFSDLGDATSSKPEALDWMATLKAAAGSNLEEAEKTPDFVARYEAARRSALSHAVARWRQGRDPAWLVAALSLVQSGDPQVAELLSVGRAVRPSDPAWLSTQHHLVRLTLTTAPASDSRRRLDAILGRRDLSVSDRNVFMAQRAQVASSLSDFVRFALRRRLCQGLNNAFDVYSTPNPPCVRPRWDSDEIQPFGIYDGVGDKGVVGLGEDARAIIDRAPLSERIALSRDRRLPAALRLDIALTSYGRAVQLQDGRAVDQLANELERLLPLMATDFMAVRSARPGPDKRFAEFFVLAKIPGVRVDLVKYTRPAGRHVADFQSHWTDWVIPTRRGAASPPPLVSYQTDGTGFYQPYEGEPWPDPSTDLTCLGECGRGAAPLRLPDFIAKSQSRARLERSYFISMERGWDKPEPPMPAGSVDAWDEMLNWAKANPRDPRVPEALHWLVHVGHYGGSHNHSGRRAFRLLHARYENTDWARKTLFYND